MFEWRTPEPEKPVLDTGYLARLGGHLGAVVLDELMADGLIELTDRLTRLDELAAAGNIDAIARLGHDLVGMAGHLGLTRLSAAAAELNRAARDGAADQAVAIVAEIRGLGADSVDAMRQYLDGISGG
ncbi:MAG: Hpt domain-containing protein [Proteobacteria bacterium]|nr:Hpt domain-containing protein [Pseudomonadota bacterium]